MAAQASIGSQNCWSSQPRADIEQARKRLRLGAPFDRGELLDHQRERERREHIEMLLEALQHRPHRDDLGDDAEHRAAGEREHEPHDHRQAEGR